MSSISKRLEIGILMLAVAITAFGYGALVMRYEIFPYEILRQAYYVITTHSSILGDELPMYYSRINGRETLHRYEKESAQNGINLVTSVGSDLQLSVKVIDMHGNQMHQWNVNWFDVWPDATHLPEKDKPKSLPGTHVHGAVMMENGDLIFNYEHLGLVKLDICSNVVWRLPYRTHHSVFLDESNNLWVSAQKNHSDSSLPELTNYIPSFIEPMLLEVSQEGEILQEISVFDVLRNNGLNGLLYLHARKNASTSVSGDTLHLNDVETFQSSMEEGFFKDGDIMVSLRNINTVFVIDPVHKRIKYKIVGDFVRQHDPDFIDGNTISVYDNNNIAPVSHGHQSRIVLHSPDNVGEVYYDGDDEYRFYSDIMGKHQWLPNGNLLITESMSGRAFEIDGSRNIVWQYFNIVGNNLLGLVEDVQRLPISYGKVFNEQVIGSCKA